MAERELTEENRDKKKSEEIEKQLVKVDPKVFEGVPKSKKNKLLGVF